MQDYYKIHADSLDYFKNEARKAFAPICSSFDLQEEDLVLRDTDNLFQITFSNSKIRIVAEGINWGMNTAVYIGANKRDSYLYSIQQLTKTRKPEKPIEGSQIDQLYQYSHYLMTYATDILQGGTSFFDQQEALRKQEEENARKAMEAEFTRKIAEGCQKIDVPFVEPVWRKNRPLLSAYNVVKDKFPHSFEVVADGEDLSASGRYEATITEWKVELNEVVMKDQVICEVSTDKVCVEIVAPRTGELIWLLEEGTVFKIPTCIALLN